MLAFNSKIQTNMSAINERGLVGKVIQTTSNKFKNIIINRSKFININ